MRNRRWSKAMIYGEDNANNSGWPDTLPWFTGKDGMENFYNGLLSHGFNDIGSGKIIGQNWFDFLESGLKPLA